MKITVLGATGGTGVRVVRHALASGHQVTAVVRDRARLDVPDHPDLGIVVADPADQDALAPAITGSDAVVSALGHRGKGPSRVCRDSAPATIGAMTAAGVRRLVVVSASGMHTTGDGALTKYLVKPLLGRLLREGFEDMLAMEKIVAASDLDWTIVRPPRLTEGPRTGRIRSRVGANVRGSFSISRADLAEFLVRTATDGVPNRAPVSVAHG